MTNPPPAIRIYRASSADTARARAIVDTYCHEINVVVRDTDAAFATYFGDDSGIWLAEEDTPERVVVGCIILRPQGGDRVPPRSSEVKRLYVLPQARGQRVAERLLEALHAYAEAAGYDWLYLDTKDDLVAAIKFYKRQGYEVCERYNDNPQATIFMRRPVEGA